MDIKKAIRIYQGRYLSLFGQIENSPAFIFGNQKSGTTAIAAMIEYACRISTTLDLWNEIKNPTFQTIRNDADFGQFIKRNKGDFCRKIIKEPNLSLFIEEIYQHFENPRAIFIIRDPRHNIRSICNRMDLAGDLVCIEEIEDRISRAWRYVLDNSWRGISGDSYIESLANRWCYMNNLYEKYRKYMTLIRYEDFCLDKQATINRSLDILGLPNRRPIKSIADKQFQFKGNKVGNVEFFSGEALELINIICKKQMIEYGYQP